MQRAIDPNFAESEGTETAAGRAEGQDAAQTEAAGTAGNRDAGTDAPDGGAPTDADTAGSAGTAAADTPGESGAAKGEGGASAPDGTEGAHPADSKPEAKEKPAPWTAETSLRVIWANGRGYAGFAQAPALGLSWPIQADWRGDALSVSPGVFFGKPYADRFLLIGHNYPSHFGNIEDLRPGDEVTFRDFSGNEFAYQVIRTDYLEPADMEALLNDPAALTLVTCARDGRRRAAVRCRRGD